VETTRHYQKQVRLLRGLLASLIRYRRFVTPWFDFSPNTPNELADLPGGAGWQIRRTLQSGDDLCIAVIDKRA
jgi:hypothetical protein